MLVHRLRRSEGPDLGQGARFTKDTRTSILSSILGFTKKEDDLNFLR